MELLSPAGNIEKLYYAYLYGADAAYIGIKNFSLRLKADNFADNEHEEIKKIKGNRKLYIALNIFFHDGDIKNLEREIEYISCYPADGFIISDVGLVKILQKYLPKIKLHLSTQANCVNTESVRLYRDLGFSRIILGRELSLKEIGNIKNRVPDVEIETFCHGAMCLAYSGRCFLSKYMTGRSANKGGCAHSCRWGYRVLEESEREGEYYPLLEGENFTTILSSRDICMIDHIRDLKNAGVDSIKIEGRMKSLYYTAIVTRAYRKMLDLMDKKTKDDRLAKKFRDELYKVSHREFTTGFFYGRNEIEKPTLKSYERSYKFLGTIGRETANGCREINIKNQIKQNDTIEYIGPDIVCIQDKNITLYDENSNKTEKADHGKIYSIKTDKSIRKGYIVRKKNQSP